MIVQLMGLAAIFVVVYFVYKTAKENRRNSLLWGVSTLIVGLATQFVVPFFLVGFFVILYRITGTPPNKVKEALETPAEIIVIACIPLSVILAITVLRFVARIPTEGSLPSKPNELSIYSDDE